MRVSLKKAGWQDATQKNLPPNGVISKKFEGMRDVGAVVNAAAKTAGRRLQAEGLPYDGVL